MVNQPTHAGNSNSGAAPADPATRPLPLDGVRVLEVASWVAGPSAGAIMADLGAEVIKVEATSGDAMRGLLRPAKRPDGTQIDGAFEASNRGKKSIGIALGSDEGRAVAHRLVSNCDIVLLNLLPGRQRRYGLDPETCHALNPALVHATITGYGTSGPDADRPGFDVTAYFARGSHTHGTIEPGSGPVYPRAAVGDNSTGLALLGGILAGLRSAERTGVGHTIEASLLHTAAWTMSTELSSVLNDGRQPSARGRHELITPLANRYPCGDGRWVTLTMPENRWWPLFCEAIDRSEWVDDERFATPRARFDNMRDLVDLIDEALSPHDRDHWGAVFDRHGLIWAPIQSMAELAVDPQAEAMDLFADVAHDEAGSIRLVTSPVRIDGRVPGPRTAAPRLGDHTDEILAAAGFDAADVEQLRADGAIQ